MGCARTAARFAAVLAAGFALTAAAPVAAQSVSTDYAAAPAGTYTLDKAHTSVTLKVSHMGLSGYTFRMSSVQGTLAYDPAHPEASKLDVQIDANSVDTGDPAFDRQIATQVLDASHSPTIRFVATTIKVGAEGRGEVIGDLTLHGQTHPVTLDVIFNGFAKIPQDNKDPPGLRRRSGGPARRLRGRRLRAPGRRRGQRRDRDRIRQIAALAVAERAQAACRLGVGPRNTLAIRPQHGRIRRRRAAATGSRGVSACCVRVWGRWKG